MAESGIEFLILGPLQVRQGGKLAVIEQPRTRALLAYLLLHANEPVSADRLLDEFWGSARSRTAKTSLQNYVSRLRRILGAARIPLEPAGYTLHVALEELDLARFQQLVREAERTTGEDALTRLCDALALWRGPPLLEFSDEPFLHAQRRLEELRLSALERRIDLELELGRHASVSSELEQLVHEHPLRERLRFQLMLALYREGRQADALNAYRDARSTLVAELGIEPTPMLRELEAQILRQAPELELASPQPARAILVAPLDSRNVDRLLDLAEPLAQRSGHELIVTQLVENGAMLQRAASELHQRRDAARSRGTPTRTAAFTSAAPAEDLLRLATQQNVDLLILDAPPQLLDDANVVTLLARAPCDVAVMTCASAIPPEGPLVVPFGGAEHDWAAIEVAGWFAAATRRPLLLAGPTAEAARRDASRLLATAALAVDRAVGVAAAPLLVEPSAAGVLAASQGASLVVAGLSPAWPQRGLGPVRTALAKRRYPPTVLVRQGLRPSRLAPGESLTRFTWSIVPTADANEHPNA